MDLGCLGRSLGGTGGGIMGSFRLREDFVSRSGRGRPGNWGREGYAGGYEGSCEDEELAEESGGEIGGDVGGVAS